ncbi:MAG: sigma-70 family RNA polymerase sigma factor [Planctomycetes bacterium]|nr:sigma-70 family RNA polymerase sigma factor [Planctomycetota bacterium]
MEDPTRRAAFEILVREHHARLIVYAHALVRHRALAEDLVQDAFVIAYRRLPDYDPARDFAAWMRGIIRFKYLEWKRSRQEQPLDAEVLEGLETLHCAWDDADRDAGGDVLTALRQCMPRLADLMRRPLELFYFDAKSCAEIASELGASEEVVRKRLQRGREMLLACITGRGPGRGIGKAQPGAAS